MANLFVVRGYLDNGLDLYMELFKLAKDNQIDGEFGLIDACSFFAENCSDFKRKFPKENLNLIIEKCYGVTIRKYDELKDLSSRKQIQVCFCLLNLVLFYYEQDGDYKREIYLILGLVFKTIGGIDDKVMEASIPAVVGSAPKVSKPVNKTIQSNAVRIKFYSVLFTIITKYQAPSAFHPTKYGIYAHKT